MIGAIVSSLARVTASTDGTQDTLALAKAFASAASAAPAHTF